MIPVNCVDRFARPFDQRHAQLSALAAFLGDHHRRIGRLLDLVQDVAHPRRRVARLLRQLPNFHRHDREAFAVLTRPRRLDTRVQRQQLGLTGDLVHRGDDFADLLGALGQRQNVLGDALDPLRRI